jgi:hypothetical protein
VIRQLKQENLPAVFGSEVSPSKVLDQIAREAGVQFIATLRDDDLPGTPGSPQHSYIGMMLKTSAPWLPHWAAGPMHCRESILAISLEHANASTPRSVNQVVRVSKARCHFHTQDDHAGSPQPSAS